MNAVGLMKATGKYKNFDGVLFDDKQFPPSESNVRTCRERCDAEKNCGSFSYKSRSMQCVLSGDGVTYDRAFKYYEKNDVGAVSDIQPEEEEADAQEDDEEDEDMPKFVPPDDSALNAKLAATRERVKQVEKELQSPNPALNLNKKAELKAKGQIKSRERQNEMAAAKNRLTVQETYELGQKKSEIEHTIRHEEKVFPKKLKEVADAAFHSGFKASQTTGNAAFNAEVSEIMKARQQAMDQYTGMDPNAGLKAIQKKQEEKKAKRLSLEKMQAGARIKEAASKREAHQVALSLSKKAAALITSEAKDKNSLIIQKESKAKDREKAQNNKLAQAAYERGQKGVMLLKSSEKQHKDTEHFQLKRAKDKNQAMETQLSMLKKSRIVAAAAKEQEEARLKRMEAASGVQERSAKDQAKAGAKESLKKQRAKYQEQQKLKGALERLEKAGIGQQGVESLAN